MVLQLVYAVVSVYPLLLMNKVFKYSVVSIRTYLHWMWKLWVCGVIVLLQDKMADKSDLKAELERKKQRLAQIREEKKRKEEEKKKKEVR